MKRQSRRVPPIIVTDIDFADDIALVSDGIKEAEEMLRRDSSEKYVKIRKARDWRTCHQMRNIWNSKLSRKFKIRLMIATIESVLLYGCETWTLTNSLLKKLDGTYT